MEGASYDTFIEGLNTALEEKIGDERMQTLFTHHLNALPFGKTVHIILEVGQQDVLPELFQRQTRITR